MFNIIEKRASIICIGIFVAIVVSGKLSGGTLKGMLMLAFCVTSAVWLWMKDVIKRGRTFEWSSEQLRGKTVRPPPRQTS